MASLAHHFRTMAFNNAWANHRLLKACAQLSDAEFAAPRTSFFPSLRHTLNHNLTVDWYYVDLLERSARGQPPNLDAGRFFAPEQPFAACADDVLGHLVDQHHLGGEALADDAVHRAHFLAASGEDVLDGRQGSGVRGHPAIISGAHHAPPDLAVLTFGDSPTAVNRAA